MSMEVGIHTVVLKLIIKYLGVMFDAKLSFEKHLELECQKAASATEALAKTFDTFCFTRYFGVGGGICKFSLTKVAEYGLSVDGFK